MKKSYLLLLFVFISYCVNAQYYDNSIKKVDLSIIQNALNNQKNSPYSSADVSSWMVKSDASSRSQNSWFYYVVQTHNSIEVRNAIANVLVNNNIATINNSNFVPNLESKINALTPEITALDAIGKALEFHGLKTPNTIKLLDFDKTKNVYEFSKTEELQSNIKVNLIYERVSDSNIILTWNVNLDLKSGKHWWNTRIDAVTGKFVNQNDWVTTCNWSLNQDHTNHNHTVKQKNELDFVKSVYREKASILASSYRVLPYYVESPNHGSFELISNPDDAFASPNGWHNDGISYVTTRGNNVVARDDQDGNNGNGPLTNQSSPGLIFDYIYGGSGVAASSYINSSTTQIFYMSNVVHDVYYKYGFDEASGNFQQNNFGNGGTDGDPVNSDAQDGSGLNNANFSSPPDGSSGRMQMYLWNNGAYNPNASPLLVVNNTVLSGNYDALDNNFNPGNVIIPSPITEDLVLVIDSAPDTSDACDAIINATEINGKIAVIRRGICTFVSKVVAAENAGAIAVLVINNQAGDITMGGAEAAITIPSYSLNQADGEALINQMSTSTVNATFNPPTVAPPFVNIDGDYDNGVVGHEYGHGVNIRLVGGRFNSGCVNANESMGEGWGDYIGKILLLKNVDNGIALSGTGTFVVGQAPNGIGIRPEPYSGDISNNPMTYQTLIEDPTNATYTIPHGVGSVWAGMLWDLTWDLIAIHGFTDNIYDSNGMFGNTIALNLVVEGMKLTSCNPGFIDGRNAILQADQNLYGGANQCAIWSAFARRGLGVNATQGSANTTSDGNSDFTLPLALGCTPDYLITNGDDGSKTICKASETSVVYEFVFNEQNGFDVDTPFAASGLPAGATASFLPATMSDTGLFKMTVSGISPTTVGTYNIVVTPGGNTAKNVDVDLIINDSNPNLTDGDTEFSINSGTYMSFIDGATIEFAPGADLNLRLPATAFDGTLVWTGPNAVTYTSNSLSFTSVADNDVAVEGAWTVQASFTNDCGSSFTPQVVNFTVNIDASLSLLDNNINEFSVFPNPTNGIVTVSGLNKSKSLNLQLIDITGRVVYAKVVKTNNQNKIEINMSSLSTGTYFIQIESDYNKTVKKIIKR